jgi:hypothetical protein
VVKDWDQARIGINLRTKFFQPRFEEMLRRMNRSIIAQINTTNFGTGTTPAGYTLFTGTGTVANQITRADIATAWTNLASVGVPMGNLNDVSLMVNHATFGQFLADNAFTQMINVGNEAAVAAQQRASSPRCSAPRRTTIRCSRRSTRARAGRPLAPSLRHRGRHGDAARPLAVRGVYEETTIMLLGEIPCRVQVGYSMSIRASSST